MKKEKSFCMQCKYFKSWGSKTYNRGTCSNEKVVSFISGFDADGFEPSEDFSCIFHEEK
jgi:hypothetical protein